MVFYQWGLLCLIHKAMGSHHKKSPFKFLTIINNCSPPPFLTPCGKIGVERAKANTCSMVLELVLPCSKIYGFYPLKSFSFFFLSANKAKKG